MRLNYILPPNHNNCQYMPIRMRQNHASDEDNKTPVIQHLACKKFKERQKHAK